MNEHIKTVEEVIDWECAWGDCGHTDECPTRMEEVCLGCTDDADGETEIVSYTSWEYAEKHDHKVLDSPDSRGVSHD